MSIYSLLPAILLTLLALGVSGLPLFAGLDGAPSGNRHASLDGLRGFLALGVFLSHSAIIYMYLRDGGWLIPPSHFYTLAGQGGVALFFMTSGLLFWDKLLQGRAIDWRKLYVGRFFRIAPLYLTVVVIALVLVFARTGLTLRESPSRVLLAVSRWLGLGLLGQPSVNGYPWASMTLLLGVVWTLRYEWLYYFSLPALAPIARRPVHWVFALAGIVACFLLFAARSDSRAIFVSYFFFGMLSASLHRARFLASSGLLKGHFAGTVALLLLLVLGHFPDAYGPLQATLLGAFFWIVSGGNSLFGLLHTTSATRLGHASYGIYLTHGLVLSLIFSVPALRGVASTSPSAHWAVAALCDVVLVVTALLAHLVIERPLIAFGKRRFG